MTSGALEASLLWQLLQGGAAEGRWLSPVARGAVGVTTIAGSESLFRSMTVGAELELRSGRRKLMGAMALRASDTPEMSSLVR